MKLALQITEALEAAHEKGIIHRDLKPQNIMIDRDGQVKIMDFGIARTLRTEGITSPGMMIGTPKYMSPEQAEGKEVDERSDIYGLGIILYEMLTGKHAFDGETVTDVLAAVVRAEPDWDLLPENTPRAMRKLLERCLKKDAKQRLVVFSAQQRPFDSRVPSGQKGSVL